MSISPAVGATYFTPRFEQSLDYAFALNLQFSSTFTLPAGATTYTNRLVYANQVYVAPTVDFLSSVTLTEAPVNAVAIGAAPGSAVIAATPAVGTNLQITTSAGFVEAVTENTRLTESASVIIGEPINESPSPPKTFAPTVAWAVDHAFGENDNGTLTLSDTLAHFGAGTDVLSGTTNPAYLENLTTLIASWRHDYTADLASTLAFGALTSFSPGTSGSFFAQPTGTAALHQVS